MNSEHRPQGPRRRTVQGRVNSRMSRGGKRAETHPRRAAAGSQRRARSRAPEESWSLLLSLLPRREEAPIRATVFPGRFHRRDAQVENVREPESKCRLTSRAESCRSNTTRMRPTFHVPVSFGSLRLIETLLILRIPCPAPIRSDQDFRPI